MCVCVCEPIRLEVCVRERVGECMSVCLCVRARVCLWEARMQGQRKLGGARVCAYEDSMDVDGCAMRQRVDV